MVWGVGARLEGIEVFVLSVALLRMSSSVCAEATGVYSLHHVYMHYCVFCACKHKYMGLWTIMSIHGWVYGFMYVSARGLCSDPECVIPASVSVFSLMLVQSGEVSASTAAAYLQCFAAVCFWVLNYYHIYPLLCVCVFAFQFEHIQKSGTTYFNQGTTNNIENIFQTENKYVFQKGSGTFFLQHAAGMNTDTRVIFWVIWLVFWLMGSQCVFSD